VKNDYNFIQRSKWSVPVEGMSKSVVLSITEAENLAGKSL
jgi:hypothetical protein